MRAPWSFAGRASSSRHGLQRDLRLARLGCRLGGYRRRPKGNALNEQIKAGGYPGIVKTMLTASIRTRLPDGQVAKSARDAFFYYTGSGLGGALQELEDVLHDRARPPRPVASW